MQKFQAHKRDIYHKKAYFCALFGSMQKSLQYIYLFLLLFTAYPLSAKERNFTVVIDAGHGGKDPGAIGKRGKEKNINLNVALKLGQYIEQNMTDVRVVYTRKTDTFLPLHRRAEIANKSKANLFISIHTNSLERRGTHIAGAETYTLGLHRTKENLEVAKKENSAILIESDYKTRYAGFNPNSAESYIIFEFMQDKNMAQSVQFARSIQKKFKSSGRVDRGVHQAGFLVLREATMPSVLVELGYISNPNEESFLLSEQGVSQLARSIYDAFAQYKSGVRTSNKGEKTTEEPSTPIIEEKTKEEEKVSTETIVEEPTSSPVQEQRSTTAKSTSKPVFKIQILTSNKSIRKGAKEFKGLSPIGSFREKGMYKYTYLENTNYNTVYRQLSTVKKKFPGAFIIAFKNGEKIDVNTAIAEFKKK